MRRGPLLGFGAVLAAGLVALVVVGLTEKRSDAFTLGVVPAAAVVELAPDAEVCQRPIEVAADFDRVRLQLGTFSRPGQPFTLSVRPAGGGPPRARARVEGGYSDFELQTVPLSDAVEQDQTVAVCIRNESRRKLAVYGGGDPSNRSSTAELDGRPTGADLTLVFVRPDEAGVLTLVPDIVERAALFHGSWASTALYWLLLALLLVGLATLPALALHAAFADERTARERKP